MKFLKENLRVFRDSLNSDHMAKIETSQVQLPHILIVNSYAFDKNKGVMNRNLFSDYPKERIGALTYGYPEKEFDRCAEYFYMGKEERGWIFPLNLFSNEINIGRTGILTPENFNSGINSAEENSRRKSQLREIFKSFVKRMGIEESLRPMKLTNRLKKWIRKINPDIIYAQPGDPRNIRFLLKLRSFIGARFVIHFMDDWIGAIDNHSIPERFFKRSIEKDVQSLLRQCEVNIAISSSMAESYSARYGVSFEFVQNPLNGMLVNRIEHSKRKKSDDLVVAYFGRIGRGNSLSIVDIAESVKDLAKDGLRIQMVVYSASKTTAEYIRNLEKLGVIFQKDPENSGVERMREEADLLLYPVDFDTDSIAYLRYSLPTKIPLYLASGIPVLCYGPDQVDIIKHLNESKLAYTVTVRDKELIKKEILKISQGDTQLDEMMKRAKEYVFQNFNEYTIREKFLRLLVRNVTQ